MSDLLKQAIKEAFIEVLKEHPEFSPLTQIQQIPPGSTSEPAKASSDLLSGREVEKMLHISTPTRLSWEKKGILPTSIKLNNRVYFKSFEVQKFLDNQKRVI